MTGFGPRAAAPDGPATYSRANLNDLVTLIQLKLPPHDSRSESTAQLFNSVEREIKSWEVAKRILEARRLGPDGTRGIRMCDVVHLQRRLANNMMEPLIQDAIRETTISARADHSLGGDRGRWNSVLTND